MNGKQFQNKWKVITEGADRTYLDFSVNINALGLPRSVKENLQEIADVLSVYPDPAGTYLTSCLATRYDVSEEQILCGNGADDLLYRLVLSMKPKRAIIIEPTFEEYSRALELVGCEVQHYLLDSENEFTLDRGILSAIKPDCDMIFLCNPNNPTGQLISMSLLKEIVENCEKNDVLLVVDECFIEFHPQWRGYTVKQLTAENKNLIVLDAFTKTYSLAGFRLGFCVSGNRDLLEKMAVCGQSFGVSTPAQFAGVCALQEESYMEETYQMLLPEREWLFQELKKLPLTVYPSQGNFLLLRSSVEDIREELLEKGIKVRDCSQFYGLSSEYCRIAVRERSDNVLLLEALKEILL